MEKSTNLLIDLTIDDEEEEEEEDKENQKEKRACDDSQKSSSDDGFAYFITQGQILREALEIETDQLTFDSRRLKALSKKRFEATRFSDLLQGDQYAGRISAQHRSTFLAYIMEHEASRASLSIVNNVDKEPCPKLDFEFTNHYVTHENLAKPSLHFEELIIPSRCTCDPFSGCDPRTCECRMMHRERAPIPWEDLPIMFAYDKAGLLRPEVSTYSDAPIWECSKLCSCRGICQNTVVGRERTVDLTLFKTRGKGWGLRSDNALRKGQFITIYAGELIGDEEARRRGEVYDGRVKTSYLFDLDPYHVTHEMCIKPFTRACPEHARKLSEDENALKDAALQWYTETYPDRDVDIGIDAGLWGNLSRYFNHSCDPNMQLYPVYTHERDLRRPFLAFFTTRNIEQGEELTFDYKKDYDEDVAARKIGRRGRKRKQKGGIKSQTDGSDDHKAFRLMKCMCGAAKCRKFVWANRRQV
jgi:histone-lysine N-methyltransferase SUV39H